MQDYIYTLGQQFRKIVAQRHEATALRYPNGLTLSYVELDQLSNRLAHYLHEQGIREGDVIAIFNEKSPRAYALMLAALKLGAIYTNLDVSSPWQRLVKILDRAQPSLLFIDTTSDQIEHPISNAFPALAVAYLTELALDDYPTEFELPHQLHGGCPAYIMFTSGSTGFPKGAVMSHENLLHFIDWGRTTFAVTESDIFTNANPIYFDNSVFDFYVSLFNGATLVPLSHSLVKSPKELVQAINASGCTIWFSVPSLLVYLLTTKVLSASDFGSIQRIIFGGEGFPKNKLKKLYELLGHRTQLFNVYGPTECTCICSSYLISDQDFENMQELAPLGFLSPNFSYEILPLAPENPQLGELALLGPCVGLGYYRDPERTSAAFVQQPQVGYRAIMYRTGDLVEKAANGYLHFKGRVDNQIKHMGYRIELEEIEAAFSSLPYIDEVGVIYFKINEELGFIKAFAVCNLASQTEAATLEQLKELLPPYMIPKTLVFMDQLPKNQNGKIDRNQLKTSSL